MTKSSSQVLSVKREWQRPELVQLGTIADVAGPNPSPVQNANNS
ncbi:MAG: hypothetical protein ACK4YM_08055 [Novosphingobium sp.]